LRALVDDGRAQRTEGTGAEPRYSCEHVVVGFTDPVGWEAAVYDHYHAVVGALCHKLRDSAQQATPGEHVGGSTYTFDLWAGHPFADEALALLSKLRSEAATLRRRIDDYNAQHGPERASASDPFRVVTYVGQNTIGYREDGDDDAK
jgi:hypothetical protein